MSNKYFKRARDFFPDSHEPFADAKYEILLRWVDTSTKYNAIETVYLFTLFTDQFENVTLTEYLRIDEVKSTQ